MFTDINLSEAEWVQFFPHSPPQSGVAMLILIILYSGQHCSEVGSAIALLINYCEMALPNPGKIVPASLLIALYL